MDSSAKTGIGAVGKRYMRKLVGMACLLVAGVAQSASVMQCGPNVCYVYDNAQVAAGTAYFGQPTLIGDDMRFLPTSYDAQSVDGSASEIYGETFKFDSIYSVSGADIQSISVVERGDYSITSGGSVQADLLILIANNNNALECECEIDSVSASGASSLTLWELNTVFSPASIFSSPANDVALDIQNTLTATTANLGEIAWIEKKFVSVSVSVIPVPAAVWLFGSALSLLMLRRKG